MLKRKKIDKKKLIVYILIMAIMFSGTGFFIYKNYQLTSNRQLTDFSNVFKSDDFINLNLDLDDNEEQGAVEEEAESNGVLKINIFKDPKFQALKNSFISSISNMQIGKKNPFEPNIKE